MTQTATWQPKNKISISSVNVILKAMTKHFFWDRVWGCSDFFIYVWSFLQQEIVFWFWLAGPSIIECQKQHFPPLPICTTVLNVSSMLTNIIISQKNYRVRIALNHAQTSPTKEVFPQHICRWQSLMARQGDGLKKISICNVYNIKQYFPSIFSELSALKRCYGYFLLYLKCKCKCKKSCSCLSQKKIKKKKYIYYAWKQTKQKLDYVASFISDPPHVNHTISLQRGIVRD